jgi:hypothetical protein
MAKKKVVKKAAKKKVPAKKTKRVSNSDGIVPRAYKGNQTSFAQGNQFWNLRSKHGRDKLFESPELMWEAACEYFQWCIDNPLKEQKVFHSDGMITKASVNKVRAFTMQGLCRYLNCNTDYFRSFKNQKRVSGADFSPVIRLIEETIYQQKFEHAAADQLNANIISRDLGLADSQNIKVDDRREVAELFPDELNLPKE